MEFRVKATINGKRVLTEKVLFKSEAEAKAYAKATRKFRPKSNPKVVKQ